MAKGKGKGASTGGPRKSHGPKRHLHSWTGALKSDFARAGVLSKYHDFQSWQLACTSRGIREISYGDFQKFQAMAFEQQKQFFADRKGKR